MELAKVVPQRVTAAVLISKQRDMTFQEKYFLLLKIAQREKNRTHAFQGVVNINFLASVR